MHIREYDEIGPGGGYLIEHGKETEVIFIGYYGIGVGKQIFRIFEDLNSFWAWRPEDEQLAVFNIYRELNATLTSAYSSGEIVKAYRNAVAALAPLHRVDLVEHWLRREDRMYIQANIGDELDGEYPKEQTYVKDDYWGLLALATALRCVLPIFSEAMAGHKSDDTFTYQIGFKLLEGTEFLENSQYVRLREFVDFILDKEGVVSSAGAILAGLSSSEIPDWVMSAVIADRIVTTPLPHKDDRDTDVRTKPLIVNLYRYINNRVMKLKTSTAFATKERVYESNRSNKDEDNTSVAENYPKPDLASYTALALYNHYEKNIESLARHMKADIDIEHVMRQYQLNMARTTWAPLNFQLKLTGLMTWLMGDVISPYAFGNILRPTTMAAIACAQVAAYELNFATVADIIGMVEAPRDSDTPVRGGLGEKLKSDQARILDEMLPYRRVLPAGTSGGLEVRVEGVQRHSIKNPAIHGIDRIMSEINDRSWILHTTEAIREESLMMGVGRGEYRIPFEMRNILSDFFIEILK